VNSPGPRPRQWCGFASNRLPSSSGSWPRTYRLCRRWGRTGEARKMMAPDLAQSPPPNRPGTPCRPFVGASGAGAGAGRGKADAPGSSRLGQSTIAGGERPILHMNRRAKTTIWGVAFIAISASEIYADPEQCREAADAYKSAVSEVSDALRSYSNCISGSRGHDDCSSEFSTLQSAQDEFESAVSDYESECQ
jgi:hypothetical protein